MPGCGYGEETPCIISWLLAAMVRVQFLLQDIIIQNASDKSSQIVNTILLVDTSSQVKMRHFTENHEHT